MLIDILKVSNLIRFDADFCRDIDISKQHLRNIKTGSNHFTAEHINNIVKAYDVDANWIFETTDTIFINNYTFKESIPRKKKEVNS